MDIRSWYPRQSDFYASHGLTNTEQQLHVWEKSGMGKRLDLGILNPGLQASAIFRSPILQHDLSLNYKLHFTINVLYTCQITWYTSVFIHRLLLATDTAICRLNLTADIQSVHMADYWATFWALLRYCQIVLYKSPQDCHLSSENAIPPMLPRT